MVVMGAVENTLEDVADLDRRGSLLLLVRNRVVLFVVVLRMSVASPPRQPTVQVQMRHY